MKVKWFQGREVWGRGCRRGTSPVSPLPKVKRLEKRRHGWNLSDKLAQSEILYKLTASSLEILHERRKRFSKFKKQNKEKTTLHVTCGDYVTISKTEGSCFTDGRVLLCSTPLKLGPDSSLLWVLLPTLWNAISLVSSHCMPVVIIKTHQEKAILNVHQQRNG